MHTVGKRARHPHGDGSAKRSSSRIPLTTTVPLPLKNGQIPGVEGALIAGPLRRERGDCVARCGHTMPTLPVDVDARKLVGVSADLLVQAAVDQVRESKDHGSDSEPGHRWMA